MARRQYGTGSITQRQDGRWVGRIDVGWTPNGTRKVRSVTRQKRSDVERELRRLIRERDSGLDVTTTRYTIKTWGETWLERRENEVRPASWRADRASIQQWITPTIGRRPLAQLTADDVRAVHRAVTKKRTHSTALRVHATLQAMLKAARLDGHQVPDPVFHVPAPRVPSTDRQDIPLADAIRILDAARTTPDRSRWAAALLQGMRQGECLGLQWDHVDLDAGTITVAWQLQPLSAVHGCDGTCGRKRGVDCPAGRWQYPAGQDVEQVDRSLHLVRPKTRAGVRVVPMVPWMQTALTQWRGEAPASRFVWPRPDGGPRSAHADLSAWHALQETAGVAHPGGRKFHLHEARHSTATILLSLGVDPIVVVAIMGHSSILSTRAYQHVDLTLARKALEGVAGRLQLDG